MSKNVNDRNHSSKLFLNENDFWRCKVTLKARPRHFLMTSLKVIEIQLKGYYSKALSK
jgi:hypothetical protein